MELYLLRHGIAQDQRPGEPDSSRPLTAEGQKKLASVLRRAYESGAEPSLILCSPYLRAVQTARAAAEIFHCEGEVIQTKCLTPDGIPQHIWNEIREYRSEPAILLASHEPVLSQLVAYVLGSLTLRVEMKKATMVRIDVDGARSQPHGILRWMLTPALVGK